MAGSAAVHLAAAARQEAGDMRFLIPRLFLKRKEKKEILNAVQAAEKNTSGEIRVHLEYSVKGDIIQRARDVFYKIGMDKAAERNGVLIFIATRDKKIAILGDEGIHKKVPLGFWQDEIALIEEHFKREEFSEGIALAILQIGEKLKDFFPYQKNDKNELPDEISY